MAGTPRGGKEHLVVDPITEREEDLQRLAKRDGEGMVAMIIHYAALGYSYKQIAATLKCPKQRAREICTSQSGKMEIRRLQNSLLNDIENSFKALAPRAIRTITKVMNDKNERGNTRIQAANMILDRALGKAVQKIEHEGGALKEVLEALKGTQPEKPTTIDADFTEVTALVSEMQAEKERLLPKKDSEVLEIPREKDTKLDPIELLLEGKYV